MAYGDTDTTPRIGTPVTHVLALSDYMKYQVLTAQATVINIHNERVVDLVAQVNVPPAVAKSAIITNFSITSNVVMFVAANSFANGDIVAISGLSTGSYLNGQNLQVMIGSYVNAVGATVPIPLGQFAAAFTHADVGSTSDSGTAKQIQTNLTPLGAPFGNMQGGWYFGTTFSGILPKGNPWG
jgi:hypothetical protein